MAMVLCSIQEKTSRVVIQVGKGDLLLPIHLKSSSGPMKANL